MMATRAIMHAMAEPQAVDPIVYPRIMLDGQSIEIKFRIGDLIRLMKSGIVVEDKTPVKGAEAYERTLAMLQAGVAHAMEKTPEELSLMVTIAEFPLITEAVNAAFDQARNQQEMVNARHPKPEKTPDTPAPVQETPSSVG